MDDDNIFTLLIGLILGALVGIFGSCFAFEVGPFSGDEPTSCTENVTPTLTAEYDYSNRYPSIEDQLADIFNSPVIAASNCSVDLAATIYEGAEPKEVTITIHIPNPGYFTEAD